MLVNYSEIQLVEKEVQIWNHVSCFACCIDCYSLSSLSHRGMWCIISYVLVTQKVHEAVKACYPNYSICFCRSDMVNASYSCTAYGYTRRGFRAVKIVLLKWNSRTDCLIHSYWHLYWHNPSIRDEQSFMGIKGKSLSNMALKTNQIQVYR